MRRLYVPIFNDGEPLAPADAIPVLHLDLFRKRRIPVYKRDDFIAYVYIGEQADKLHKTLVNKHGLSEHNLGYLSEATPEFLSKYGEFKPQQYDVNVVVQNLFDSFTKYGVIYERVDFGALQNLSFDRFFVRSLMTVGFYIQPIGKKQYRLLTLPDRDHESKIITKGDEIDFAILRSRTVIELQENLMKVLPELFNYSCYNLTI